MQRHPACSLALVVAILALAAASASAQIAINPAQPLPVFPDALLVPWVYDDSSGRSVWDRHQYYEDLSNTVFTLAHDFVTIDPSHAQAGAYPDVLQLNFAHFSPPEGHPAPAGLRRLHYDSVNKRGLQLYVNYSGGKIDTAAPSSTVYKDGTFFISLDVPTNTQTTPAVPGLGFSSHMISATRAALGVVGQQLSPHVMVIRSTAVAASTTLIGTPGPTASPGGPTGLNPVTLAPNALYVTAAIGYAKADIDPQDHGLVDEAWRDRLLVFNASAGYWEDHAWRLPPGVDAGNSSGVAFADFNGDGRMDLYVGKCGDNYGGAPNVLLIYNRITGHFDDRSSWITTPGGGPEPSCATNEVAAGDLDGDGDLDIAVANRARRSASGTTLVPGPEAEDYYLLNDGTGHFSVQMLAPGVYSDSRSVAVGDMDHAGALEIVLGNAGSEGYSNSLTLTPGFAGEDHPMQIFRSATTAPLAYADQATTHFLTGGLEPFVTSPLTQQVLLVDLFGPWSSPAADHWKPDGWLDLVIVNHRDMIKHDPSLVSVHNVHIATNRAGAGGAVLEYGTAFPTQWGRTVCVTDFFQQPKLSPYVPYADIFVGAGNRYAGVKAHLEWNRGGYQPAGALSPFGVFDQSYDLLPGNEHSYGFDFADYDGSGALDALQTSRGYDFLVHDLLVSGGHINPHFDFTLSSSPSQTNNVRGRKTPNGMEDGAFADFDGDGDLDAILNAQRFPSSSTPPSLCSLVPESIVLDNPGGGAIQFNHSAVNTTLSNGAVIKTDAKIDHNFRTGALTFPGTGVISFPDISDRVVVGDLDCDGDVDAIVHLFGLRNPGHANPYHLPRLDNAAFAGIPYALNPSAPTAQTLSVGWRFLKNVIGDAGTPPGTWFKDIAASNMVDAGGSFSPAWNRPLGSDVLADFDSNGRLDLYSTAGAQAIAANGAVGSTLPPGFHDVEDIAQLRDLVFLNGSGTDPAGLLRSKPNLLPNQGLALDVVADVAPGVQPGDITWDSANSPFVAQGDIDNDGDPDVIVTHGAGPWRTNYPWLLVNRIREPAVRVFTEEFRTRVPVTAMSPVIHTFAQSAFPGETMDHVVAATFMDYDADGDLDLVWQVGNDYVRVLRNRGEDLNADGVINAADVSPLGTFEDVTAAVLAQLRATSDATDIAPVDVDGDGDFDLAVNSFSDTVCFLRNDQQIGDRPRVTEAWPRVGSIRGRTVELHGANLDTLVQVEFRSAGGSVVTTAAITNLSPTRAQVVIPAAAPLGLAQIRVQRQLPGTSTLRWSRQYFAYFILG